MAALQLVLVGLGNASHPLTRHSIGQLVLTNLATYTSNLPGATGSPHLIYNKTNASWSTHIHVPSSPDGPLDLTFVYTKAPMNLSGPALLMSKPSTSPAIPAKFKTTPSRVITLLDELDLAPSDIAVRKGGSAKGHNGVRSMETALGSKDFWRVRIGIGRPPTPEGRPRGTGVAQWVLAPMEREVVDRCKALRSNLQPGDVIRRTWEEVLKIAARESEKDVAL